MFDNAEMVMIGLVCGCLGLLVGALIVNSDSCSDKDRQYYNPIANQQQLAPKRDKDDATSILVDQLSIIMNELHKVNETLEGLTR